jgi:hypothetical protein
VADVDQTMLKVQRILTGSMGLRIEIQESTLYVRFSDVSTQLRLDVLDWGTNQEGEPSSLVRVSSPVLWGVDPSPELFEWVAREGGTYFFGHVSAHEDSQSPGKVFLLFSHTLLADYLDEGELTAAFYGVLNTADDLDDRLQARFGGRRLADH